MVWVAPVVNRIDEPFVAPERAMLEGFLDWQRTTLLHKCTGLTGEQLVQRAAPPSRLSLLGLIRHLTNVERHWFRIRFAGIPVELPYPPADDGEPAFDAVDPGRAELDHQALVAEWEASRQAVAGSSLEDLYEGSCYGPVSLRWICNHMVEEYARHNGHADLLRERIDGTTGG